MSETPVVTVFLRNRGNVLLCRRSPNVGSYPEQWATVTGHVESNDPVASAWAEIEEETGLTEADVQLVREGASFPVEDETRDTKWLVHPFLFKTSTRSIDLNREADRAEWGSPTAILRRETVPELWTSYRRVAPSGVELRNDTSHGSAALSVRALEILRDRAGILATTEAPDIEDARARLVETAVRLLDARPSMAALTNRIHRVMHASANQTDVAPSVVERNAHDAIGPALDADAEAARRAAEQIGGKHVLTLSRSGTVLDALQHDDPSPSVVVASSRPGGEGVKVAETLVKAGLDVGLIPDSAIAATLAADQIDLVLVGADTVLPSGTVVNKVGTRGLAIAARREGIPFYVTCAADKISVADTYTPEYADPRTVYDGASALSVSAPRFDATPADLVTGIITDRGSLPPEGLGPVVEDLERLRAWR